VRLLRDFKAEKAAAAALLDRLPQFAGLDGAECDWTWPVVDPQACLEVIDSLEELRGMVPIEWAKNARPITTRRADVGAMRVQVSTAGDWFALSGQVEVEPGTLLEMTALLERWDERRGRFVPLGDGRWLALSRRLQQRVEEMRALAHAESREGLRLHSLAPLAAPQLMDGLGGAALADEWRRRAKRWEEAGSMEIAVPSTLQAELRPYQEEGFRWLARLAYAGAGACLADDMGLGKTLQALALLLLRGADGPALVLAPASVTPNWLAEARRFAPTLNCTLFGSGDRASTIRDAGPFDVIVASYGILATEAELLASRPWHTLLLDEAQAIKNQQTIRSQAVMDMRADFRLALTGTPLENHLGELWNLFRFLNPGLLGSRERFENRFAQPIERLKDRAAMANLKRVISPFILRRTKQEVLPDLPPATEITLKVPMEPAERAFYEAVREQALRTLEDIGQEATARVRVLAEIMRLRRACCHPSLLVPDCGLSGSKMAEFLRLAAELRDNRHRALVFSQFVDHLALLRVALDKAGITYQYLDGSTPIAEREAAVRRFQGGEGDLFLISLKAGGTGLNLTAADYVIHMDPWWNPAVEDQASARAHRIGQDRPVTIYRLVMENSIEERIVALHHSKRRMADDLLDETSQAGRLSAQELLALIRLH
jgi:SNF2 family DNA or RNA helicase